MADTVDGLRAAFTTWRSGKEPFLPSPFEFFEAGWNAALSRDRAPAGAPGDVRAAAERVLSEVDLHRTMSEPANDSLLSFEADVETIARHVLSVDSRPDRDDRWRIASNTERGVMLHDEYDRPVVEVFDGETSIRVVRAMNGFSSDVHRLELALAAAEQDASELRAALSGSRGAEELAAENERLR